jgi:uncharacterized protein (TIGR02246 family)
VSDDEAIRDTIHGWLEATKHGDTKTLADMLDDDMLFVVKGAPPFGKKEFLAGGQGAPHRFEAKVEIPEVTVHGDWALTRVNLEIEMAQTPGAEPLRLAGPTMTVWRRTPDGRWTIWRDANMVAPVGT